MAKKNSDKTPIEAQPTLTEEQWYEKYKPVVNHLDKNASWQDEEGNGVMFETFGPELDFVFAADYHKVWTYVDSDYGTAVVSGRTIVNRIGYFICEVPWADGENFEFTVIDDRLCGDCDELPEACICGDDCECKNPDEDEDED